MAEWLKQLRNEVIELFFPRQCIECGKVGDFLCAHCASRLPRLIETVCEKCGKLEGVCTCGRGPLTRNGKLDDLHSVFVFQGTVRDAVYKLKYDNVRALSGTLAAFMADYYSRSSLSADVLIPVPLHARRLRQRGYNQSELLAREIGRIVSVPVRERLVTRTRDSKPQARSGSVVERRQNMEDAFTCAEDVVGMRTIIVDDVCTSGATLEACASALKAFGARRVEGLTLAREI